MQRIRIDTADLAFAFFFIGLVAIFALPAVLTYLEYAK